MYTINTIRQVKKIKNESKKQAPSPYLELSQSINLTIIIYVPINPSLKLKKKKYKCILKPNKSTIH